MRRNLLKFKPSVRKVRSKRSLLGESIQVDTETPLLELLRCMDRGDMWEDAGLKEVLRYASERALIPEAYRPILAEFL